MITYHLFMRETGECTAVATAALNALPISEELGEPLLDMAAVPEVVALAFVKQFGGRLIH